MSQPPGAGDRRAPQKKRLAGASPTLKRRTPMLSKCAGGMMTAIAVVMLAPGGANAQPNYPNHTVKFVIPTPPGPTLDSLPRLIAGHLSDRWKVPVIIENI